MIKVKSMVLEEGVTIHLVMRCLQKITRMDKNTWNVFNQNIINSLFGGMRAALTMFDCALIFF